MKLPHFHSLSLLAIAFFFCASAQASEPPPETISIFKDKAFHISLTSPPSKNSNLVAAVNDFRRYLHEMTGDLLPDRPGPGLIPIIFDIANPKGTAPSPDQPKKWSDFQIHVQPEAITIKSVSSLGASNALYTLLDLWGCRWIMPGKIGECIPQSDTLSLDVGTVDGNLSSDFRVTRSGSPLTGEWQRRNRNGMERWLSAQHFWSYIVPEDTYFDPNKPETYHPEYYALIGGKRTPTQICTSNPEVIALGIEKAGEFFRRSPTADSFPVDPNDNIDFCQCEECRKLDP